MGHNSTNGRQAGKKEEREKNKNGIPAEAQAALAQMAFMLGTELRK